ncbi:kinesin-domain-containing protein [Laetiporus sulphureus 93-53]|uniref:Kinesin-domain-containing protein n=1 Tax=Laetiporus sulphureus 93-53 TaxID=1314785 RepID=A0A165FUL0_9APHY|nr:kinesin-domain-containing protein [Laetiporus sulphureus 93-53]KZT09433.1 kinesin-domain-containing protein [Laetiporus sulphureus 93-53]
MEDSPAPTPALNAAKTVSHTGLKDDTETNIQVIIRCRRRSDREQHENSPIIVTTDAAKPREITIESAIPSTALGLATLPPTKKYGFDLVFGPEADQATVYQEVVRPMLDEVIKGYNCTLFAYGQTGTGKTYTMQGELGMTVMGNPSPHAGMIPRVLFSLFHQLESSAADYTVKVSFVELYNEELRDLLAPELASPMGSIQPMGLGVPKENAGQGNLKIFDDSTKKGVLIQGLEEFSVKDATDALALLDKGSQRRQIAATKFNDHSSRSHSVFSITVHSKEKSSMGDDLLRVGKMNLVDLAGSENIGRSGAENKRAREAGLINQSLLTLGRVINALVDKSPHVPYRESKLTRLLQDSLGGRTKTCIIATISPARSNMEETLSTLDYAMRAKSIQNRPEINQRLTRNSLLKEYVAVIDRLKADLLAAREKNGIYFTQDSYDEMAMEKELKETNLQEARKEVEIVANQLRNVREEFEQSIALLATRDNELKQIRGKLTEKEGELEAKETQLMAVKDALEDEVFVREAYQDAEGRLDGVATGLKKVTYESLGDLGRLHSKLERKTAVFNSNVNTVATSSSVLSTETEALSSKLNTFIKTSNEHVQKIRTEAEEFQAKECKALNTISQRISQQLEKIRDAIQTIHAHEEESDKAVNAIQDAVQETQDSIAKGFTTWTGQLQIHCEKTCREAESTCLTNCANVETAFRSLGDFAETILQEAQKYIAKELEVLQEAKDQAEATTNAEIQRLQEQNAMLQHLVESEKQRSEGAKDELIKRISSLLADFTGGRDRSLRDTLTTLTKSNETAEGELKQAAQEQGQQLEKATARGQKWNIDLKKRGREAKRTRDGGFKALEETRTAIRNSTSNVQAATVSSASSFVAELQLHTQRFSMTCNDELENASHAKRARIENTDNMATEAESGYQYVCHNIASTSKHVDATFTRIISESSSLSSASKAFSHAATGHIAELSQTTQKLTEDGMREDRPTTTTPRKRSWDYVDKWQLTKNREALLKERKARGYVSPVRLEAAMEEHISPPEQDNAATVDEMLVDEVAVDDEPEKMGEEEEEENLPLSDPPPSLKSMSSSTSSASSVPTPPPAVATKRAPNRLTRKSAIPAMGKLTERPANLIQLSRTKRFQR